MKYLLKGPLSFLTITMWMAVWYMVPADLHADQANGPEVQSRIAQQLFASPEEAVKALQTATQNKDQASLRAIFGPTVQALLTGDQVQDANNARRFAAVMAQSYTIVKEGDDKATIEIGPDSWPMPIPLMKINGYWLFDTAAGKEEIINRHIGKDELNAIGICQAYVRAQEQYAIINPEKKYGTVYAQRFKSTPGKKDGLYWPSAGNELASPLEALVAQAKAEGYFENKVKASHPFHGYYFKILTRQGKDAPGGRMDYMSHGLLTRGFALMAYPVLWGKSGIMTFIVNQEAHVYQQDLGPKTSQIVSATNAYDPDAKWSLVQDQGILSKDPVK